MQEVEEYEHWIEEEEEVGLPVQMGEVHSPRGPVDDFSWEQVDSQVKPGNQKNDVNSP